MVTILRCTFSILSTNGTRKKSPGPLGPPRTRPKRKITPRSYSLTILIALIRMPTTTITTTMATAVTPIPVACNNATLMTLKPLFLYSFLSSPLGSSLGIPSLVMCRTKGRQNTALYRPSFPSPSSSRLASSNFLTHRPGRSTNQYAAISTTAKKITTATNLHISALTVLTSSFLWVSAPCPCASPTASSKTDFWLRHFYRASGSVGSMPGIRP